MITYTKKKTIKKGVQKIFIREQYLSFQILILAKSRINSMRPPLLQK